MKKKLYRTGLLIIMPLAVVLSSCLKQEDYPNTPEIKFVSFTKIQNAQGLDEKGILKISFTDGGGNIGLAESDTLPPFNMGSKWYYNFFIDYFERQHGVWTRVTLPSTMNSRIPLITGTGNNKPIKGDIEIELYILNPVSTFDTIAFEASIADRDTLVSNVIRTPEIVVKKH